MKQKINQLIHLLIVISIVIASNSTTVQVFAQLESEVTDEVSGNESLDEVVLSEEIGAPIIDELLDEESPVQEIINPDEVQEELKIYVDTLVDDNTLFINGTTLSGLNVELLANGQLVATTISNINGEFNYELSKPFEAGTILTFRVVQENGNSEEYQISVAHIGLSVQSLTNPAELRINGQTSPSRAIELYDESNQLLQTVTSDEMGHYVFVLSKSEEDRRFSIQVLDNGKMARQQEYFVPVMIELLKPELVVKVNSKTTSIVGITTPNVNVELLKKDSTVIQSVNSDDSGAFVFELEESFESETLLQIQARHNENESEALMVRVEGVVNSEDVASTVEIVPYATNGPLTLNPIRSDDTIISGVVDIDMAEGLLAAVVGLLASRTFYITLTDNLGNNYGEKRVDSGGAFQYILNQPLPPGTQIKISLRAQYRLLLGLITSWSDPLVEVTEVVQGILSIIEVPDSISFQPTQIAYQPDSVILRDSPTDLSVEVSDQRYTTTQWELTARALQPLTNTLSGAQLNSALFYRSGATTTPLNSEAVVANNQLNPIDETTRISTIEWGQDEGIILKTNPWFVEPGDYTSVIQWTLKDAP